MQRLMTGLSKYLPTLIAILVAVFGALVAIYLPTQRETEIQCYGGQWQTVGGTYLVKDGIRLDCR